MREGWEIKKLGDACLLTMGQSPDSSTYNEAGNGMPFFQGCADFGVIHPTITTFCSAPKKIAEVDDVIMSVRAPIGTLNVANVQCCIGRGLASIRQKPGITIYKYLYYFISKSKKRLQDLGTGATFKAIGKETLVSFPIPVPPVQEQEKIVAELDCLSGIIEKKKQQLKELDNLAQSIFYDMFGDLISNDKKWNTMLFKDACESIGDGLHGTPIYDECGTIAFINGNNLIDGRIVITSKTLFVNENEAKKIFIPLTKHTILLSINGTLGKVAIYNNEPVVLGKSACYCTLKPHLLPKFVYGLMCSSSFQHFLEENSSKSTIKNVGLKAIRGYRIICPPIDLQNAFVQKIEAMEKQKELIKKSIQETETLFNSRMDYWFN